MAMITGGTIEMGLAFLTNNTVANYNINDGRSIVDVATIEGHLYLLVTDATILLSTTTSKILQKDTYYAVYNYTTATKGIFSDALDGDANMFNLSMIYSDIAVLVQARVSGM